MATKIMSYSQSTTDVRNEMLSNRRNIGTLIAEKTSLSVRSSLLAKDKSDVFTFKLQNATETFGILVKASGETQRDGTVETLSSTNLPNNIGKVRVQILDRYNKVIADSSTGATFIQQEAYKAIRNGAYKMEAGTYTLQVTRAEGVLNTEKPGYAIQLFASASYTKKYDTVEYAYSLENDASLAATESALAIMLTTAPPDGSETTNIFDTLSSNYANFLV